MLWKFIFSGLLSLHAADLPPCQTGAPSSLNWPMLEKILTSENPPMSIDELMLMTKDHLDYWTAVYESRSLQAKYTTPERPRILAYGSDAKLIMTFASCEFQGLEIMEYNEKDQQYVFREVMFGDGRPKISEPNSRRCLGCHSSNPRPLWNTYNFWPGVYGSLTRFGVDVIANDSPESKYYETFKAHATSENICKRYKALRWSDIQVDGGVKESLKKHNLKVANLGRCGNSANDVLTNLLVHQNMKKNISEIATNPQFPHYKAALKSIENVEGYSDEEWQKKFFSEEEIKSGPSLTELREEIDARQRKSFLKFSKLTLQKNTLACPDFPDDTKGDIAYCPMPFALQTPMQTKTARFQFVLKRMGMDVGRMTISPYFHYSFSDLISNDRFIIYEDLDRY